jgi:hypothetical protein
MIASPAKALCDFFYLKPHTARDLIELRIDATALRDITSPAELKACAARYGQKTLIAIIDHFISFFG